ncbi:Splicing factor U2af large subunit A [Dendrobium catenatum]|uniref:Splicing factor U2af large subunit A n=1 Tax=Dendrobium catenatum TaxID=906689 RepID=A0A2I0VLS6_9ASPA|nr:Splicing factor U2af large subunit A [Dendrobium catenatum]
MGRTDVSNDVSRRNPIEGTSARTRAFSFEEIMSRRKKKENSNANESDIKIHESFENANDTQDHSRHDVHLQIRSPSKKFMKERSKKKESTSKRERDAIERKHTSSRDLETDAKVKSIHGKISRNQESTEEKYSRHSSKSAKLLATESEKASRKKRVKDFDENDKYDEHYRISKRDRKGDYHYDDKGRSKNDSKKYKKHESIKLQDLKYSGSKGHKKYHLEPSYDDPKLRRRRSRSLEYYREERRSGSMSPLSQKYSYDGKDHGECHKDNSKKKHSDGDRYKTSGNAGYSSGHHRKHRSGLGGYSPRKRKTEAAVKTPSPTIRSPERKIATWDQLPSGTSITNSGSIFASLPLIATKVVEAVSSIAVTPATTKTHPATSIDSGSVTINSSIESVQLTQATRPLRRLYIENLPSLASEKSVIDCLNEYLVSSGANHIRTTRPCISCIINKDKAQALVEFLTPEDATAALSFDGNTLAGSVLKMRRPKDFVEAAGIFVGCVIIHIQDRDKERTFYSRIQDVVQH